MVTGGHHIAESQQVRDEAVVDGTGHSDERTVGHRHPHVLALAAGDQVTVLIDATKEGNMLTGIGQSTTTCLARAVGDVEGRDDEVTCREGLDGLAHLLDDPNELVADRARLINRRDATVRPEVGTADAGRDHPHHNIRRHQQHRVRALLHAHVTLAI
jgi:hypothetical protein